MERSCGPRTGAAARQVGRDGCLETAPRGSSTGTPMRGRPFRPAHRRALPPPPAVHGPDRATHPAPSGEEAARAAPTAPAAGPAGRPTKPARYPAHRGRKAAPGPALTTSGSAVGVRSPPASRRSGFTARRGRGAERVSGGRRSRPGPGTPERGVSPSVNEGVGFRCAVSADAESRGSSGVAAEARARSVSVCKHDL